MAPEALEKKIKRIGNATLHKKGFDASFELTIEKNEFFLISRKEHARLVKPILGHEGILSIKLDQLTSFVLRLKATVEKQSKKSIPSEDFIHFFFDTFIEEVFEYNSVAKEIHTLVLLNYKSYLHSVEIKNFFSIKNINLPNLNSKEIYFLGENGDGKSLILMALLLCFKLPFIAEQTELGNTGKILDLVRFNESLFLKGKDSLGTKYGSSSGRYLDKILAYGVYRGRTSEDKYEKYGFMSLFDNDEMLMSPEKWLHQLYTVELERRLDANNSIGEDKTMPLKIPLSSIIEMFQDLLEKNVKIFVDSTGVIFEEKGFKLSFDQLSEGYKSIMVWMTDLLYRLQESLSSVNNAHELHATVLVDEVDLHLHIIWQKEIVKKLRKFFPNVQFIFTTHSPMIIQGASPDSIIYKVFRDEKSGLTHVSEPYLKKNLNHLMLNTLVTSPLFGLEHARMSVEGTPNTSDSYLLYRINKKLEERLVEQKALGKEFISDDAIDSLIDQILQEELKNDKNK